MRSRTVIGENIRNLRVNRGWTRAQLAQTLGVSQRHISAFELGNKTPSRVGIEHLAVALGVDDADLTKGLLRALPGPRTIRPVHKINALRNALDWTQAQMARELGVPEYDLWRFEAGEELLSQENLESLAEAMDVSMEGLLRCLEAPWENDTPAKPRPGRLLQRDNEGGLEPLTPDSNIGALIFRLRTEQGTSQSVLAGRVGLSRIELGLIEAGQAGLDAATRKLLAFFLDVEEVELGGPVAWVRGAMTKGTLGQVIRAARESRGWPQELLARVVRAKEEEIASYEQDMSVPGPGLLDDIAERLRVRFVWLGSEWGQYQEILV